MKKIILIITVILIIFTVIFLLVNSSQKQKTTPLAPIPNINIPSDAKSGLQVKLAIKQSDFKFPENLPILESQQTALSQDEAIAIATKAGFTGSPIKSDDVFRGATYIWNNASSSLVIYSKSRESEYALNSFPKSVKNSNISDENLKNIATNFLQNKFGLPSSKTNFSYFSYFNLTGNETLTPTSKTNASIYQVNFSPIQIDYKFLSINPQLSLIYVWVLPDGSIYKVHIRDLQNIIRSNTFYPIKNYREVTDSLSQALLVNLDNGNINTANINLQSLQNITITKAEIVYLYDSSDSQIYQPVYLLSGTGDIQGFKNGVDLIMYLPALKNP